jgi:hypothetical protein
MRILWTLFKVIVGLAIAIPLGILALGLAGAVVGTLIALAFFALKLACIALIGYGAFRLAVAMFGSKPKAPVIRDLPAPDPYYNAAMRELDSELGGR